LKQVPDSVVISPADVHSVRLGPSANSPVLNRPGVLLYGKSLRGGERLFRFRSLIAAIPNEAAVSLTLLDTIQRTPEIEYTLSLKSGSVVYQYRQGGLENCYGGFVADITLPRSNPDINGDRVTLKNVLLGTDSSGALFGFVRVPARFGLSGIFLIEPGDSSWVFFPRWASSQPPTKYLTSSGGYKGSCADLREDLETLSESPGRNVPKFERRPGLTLLGGVLHFRPSQVSLDPPSNTLFLLKTVFWSSLTMTPWGLTGNLTSSNASFIREDHPIGESLQPDTTHEPAWADVITAPSPPDEPRERFTLAGLRILDMQVDTLSISCNTSERRVFRYTVHFPFPSFVKLDFRDTSLDIGGQFHKAIGPLTTSAWTLPNLEPRNHFLSSHSLVPISPFIKEILPNPDTQILWAYRLPVSFAPQGVTITYPNDVKKALVQINATPEQINREGEIISSEIWVPPLYSTNSAVKHGIRFGGLLSSTGEFTVTSLDLLPFFAQMYAQPGTERFSGFLCNIRPLSVGGLKLSDSLQQFSTRAFDFRWNGVVQLPFFGWRDVSFAIRNLVPTLLSPSDLTAEGLRASFCTGPSVQTENPVQDPTRVLKVKAHGLSFEPLAFKFRSMDVAVERIENSISDQPRSDSLEIRSFSSATVFLQHKPPKDTVISPYRTEPSACGGTRQVQQMLLGATPHTNFVDLVCYDTSSNRIRGIPGACCNEYYLGTYCVKTRENEQSSERIIVSMPQTLWFPHASPNPLLETHGSSMTLAGDDEESTYTTVVGIPGAQLEITDTCVIGAFGATMTSLASSLPYEGEFRFLLDTRCGYYFVQAAGSFTWAVRFTGETFIVHAPMKYLREAPPFPTVPPIISDISIRLLSPTPGDFESEIGVSDLDDNTVLTGVLTAGGASFGFNAGAATLDAAVAGGSYIFQKKQGGITTYNVGGLLNGQATANIYVVDVLSGIDFRSAITPPQDVASLSSWLHRTDLVLNGRIYVSPCVSAIAGHCSVTLDAGGEYSTQHGFRFTNVIFDAGCGLGGCPSCFP